jgi:ankyrin repeat protein
MQKKKKQSLSTTADYQPAPVAPRVRVSMRRSSVDAMFVHGTEDDSATGQVAVDDRLQRALESLHGARQQAAALRQQRSTVALEDDYEEEDFRRSSDDDNDAQQPTFTLGQFRTPQEMFAQLGTERVYKKRLPYRTANSYDSSDFVEPEPDDDNYRDVERALTRQPLGIAELLREKRRKSRTKAATSADEIDVVTSSSSISIEEAATESDAGVNRAGGNNNADLARDSLDSSDELVQARQSARVAVVVASSSDYWLESESDQTLADATRALGVRVVPPHVALSQLASFHVDYTAVDAKGDVRIRVQALSSRVPFDSVSFSDVPVARFCQTLCALSEVLALAPAFVVSRFIDSSAVHVRDLLAAPTQSEFWLAPRASPIVEFAAIGGLIVALLADDALLIHDVHSARAKDDWTVAWDLSELLRKKGAPAAATPASSAASAAPSSARCLLLSEACLIIVTGSQLHLWNWRSLLRGGGDLPKPTTTFALDPVDKVILPRSDFSCVDACGRVLLGGNMGFAIYDLASEQALFRFHVRQASEMPSFHAIRWSGECVVTLEATGARVWRVAAQAEMKNGGGTASESTAANARRVITMRSPPALIEPEDGSIFCALHVDSEWALLGDSYGRIRALSLTSVTPQAARGGVAVVAPAVAATLRNMKLSGGKSGESNPSTSKKSAARKARKADSDDDGAEDGDDRNRAVNRSDDEDDDDDNDDDNDNDDDDDDNDDDDDGVNSDVELEKALGSDDSTQIDQYKDSDELNDNLLALLTRVQKYGASGLKQALREHAGVWRMRTTDGQTLLHHAAAHALLDVIGLILAKAPANFLAAKDANGWTALHTAASCGRVSVVESLLANERLSLSERASHDGTTPLHLIACMPWNVAMTPQMMAAVFKSSGGNVDERNNVLETPLHQACLRGEPDMVRWLIEHGASIDARKDTGETPLHIAARRGSLALVRLLIDRGANVQLAANDGRLARDVADGLCAEALSRAMVAGSVSNSARRGPGEVRERADDGAGASVGLVASTSANSSLMARLLGRRSERDEGPAIVALGRKGDEAELRALLRKSSAAVFAARDKHGQSVLHTAAFGGHGDIVNLLVRHKKCPPNIVQLRDKNGWTPLHAAASIGQLAIVYELLEHGGDIYTATATQRGGTTTAHYLARLPWTHELELLWKRQLAVRRDVDVRDSHGRTPLFDAASKNRTKAMHFLMAEGADPNARAHDGSTPLHTAVAGNALEAVQVLIDANVELLDADEIGTARTLAHSLGNEEVAEVLDGYHHTLFSVASPRRKTGSLSKSRSRVRASPSLAALPHRSVAAAHSAAEYLNVGVLPKQQRTAPGQERVNHLSRDGDVVFCGQESGALTQWSLSKRKAKKPVYALQCSGAVRSLAVRHGAVLALAQQSRDDIIGSDLSRSVAATSSGLRASVMAVPLTTYELLAVQWGADAGRRTFDSRGRGLTSASALLGGVELTLWMRLNIDDKGDPVDADRQTLVQPWSERGIIASLLAHRSKLVLYVDVSVAKLAAFVKAGKLKLPFDVVPLSEVNSALGRLRREHLPLAPRALRGANDGLSGGAAHEAAMPIFVTLNRGGGFVTLYTLWSSGSSTPAPAAVLRAVFSAVAAKRCGDVGAGSGVGKARGPSVRPLKGAAGALSPPPPLLSAPPATNNNKQK